MRHIQSVVLVSLLSAVIACDKGAPEEADRPKGLADELASKLGEGVLAQPIIAVYDSGYVVGRGTLDPEFGDKVDRLGIAPASALEAGDAPVRTPEFYRQDNIEFGIRRGDDPVVVIARSADRTTHLLLGPPAAAALKQCEAIRIDRACQIGSEVRVWLDDASPSLVVLMEEGSELARGEIRKGWAIFPGAPPLGDETQLELVFGEGVRCNMSKWVVDPRDSCTM